MYCTSKFSVKKKNRQNNNNNTTLQSISRTTCILRPTHRPVLEPSTKGLQHCPHPLLLRPRLPAPAPFREEKARLRIGTVLKGPKVRQDTPFDQGLHQPQITRSWPGSARPRVTESRPAVGTCRTARGPQEWEGSLSARPVAIRPPPSATGQGCSRTHSPAPIPVIAALPRPQTPHSTL